MCADDTTIYVIGEARRNEASAKFHNWCKMNLLTPHPGKTKYMLNGSKSFVGPLDRIMLGQHNI